MKQNNIADKHWYHAFFTGPALELWRRAIPHEVTEEEARFLYDHFEFGDNGCSLLDVPCGNGRLSIPLALCGATVTGVDISDEFLKEAAEKAKQYDVNIELVKADMSGVGWDNRFDGAFCMGNSFGYFDSSTCNQFLKAVGRSLKNGGRFILQSDMIAESFLVNGSEKEWVKVGDIHMLVENVYDCRESKVTTTYTFLQNGKEEQREATHWVYTCGELCRMLEAADMHVLELYSDTTGEEYTMGSPTLLLVAEKRSV